MDDYQGMDMIELLLFDLDGTLLRTDDLEGFRGENGFGQKSSDWYQQLNNAFDRRQDRVHYTAQHLAQLAQGWRLGVFTRSPRAYASTLLNKAYPGFPWSIVIAYEDVSKTKPHPEGVWLAMNKCGIDHPSKVAVVGDEKSDLLAAYQAGCWAYLDTGGWDPAGKTTQNYWTLERVPDMILSGPNDLIGKIQNPIELLPELERAGQSKAKNYSPRFDAWKHISPPGMNIREGGFISVMGRIFSNYDELKYRSAWHQLTREIADNKNSVVFPDHWVETVRTFIRISWPVQHGRDTVVTVVPFKPGRPPRLESFLSQLAASHAKFPISLQANISFVADVMSYNAGAKSHNKEHLDKVSRFENVRDHLEVKRSSSISRKHVIVIDDVVTSGASLIYASKYMKAAGAYNVNCVALAHAIGPQ
ncbi:HAD-IA family hydrolase [Xanthomonas arboricola]|uniref:HAD-IA family hydrolase n=1 Tax=Xanthomonas arboricola TaxID=56448 RepID=UPI00142FD24F|nr:HAD-IA family hydrolase [Xanthomonas arboricola]NJB77398.1 HAD superfamily hydrolase (TIGR01549 family) [Xanthomonas arboricola]